MNSNEQQVQLLISEQAADWFVENREDLAAERRSAFIAWLKASPVHVEEYLALAALAQDLPAACAPIGETIDELLATARLDEDTNVHALRLRGTTPDRTSDPSTKAQHPRRWITLGLAASFSALAVGAIALNHYRQNVHPSIAGNTNELHYRTHHGQQLAYRLADDSIMHLNTDTAVAVRFDDRERLVILESGEAAFQVVHEKSRSFRVVAGTAQVVDVGTQFDVRLGEGATFVTVTEGRVHVGLTSGTTHGETVDLVAGQQARVVDSDWPAQPIAVDTEQTTAWLHHQIKFNNEPLSRVTSEFNRYSPKLFEIETPSLQNMKISGVFATDDTETFIAFLRSLEGVVVEVTPTRIRVSKR